MDPLSQAVVGVVAAQSAAKKTEARWATLFGALSGMAPDLDVLIKSDTDPLLYFEYHRHFTHSLLFIPFGALICALVFKLLFRSCKLGLGQVYLFCLLGLGTHGLLDACTSYGTQLLWPFTNYRVSWDNISIIDPLFTLPLLALTIVGFFARKNKWARAALVLGLSYLMIGKVQNYRAQKIAYKIAETREHNPKHLSVKPSFANLVLWKSIYEHDGRFYVDAIRVGVKSVKVTEGESVKKFNAGADMPWLKADTTQYKDVQRFEWFSMGYVAIDPASPNRITDVRYSRLPHKIGAMWGIECDPEADDKAHAQRYSSRRGLNKASIQQNFQTLWQMIKGQN